MARRLRSHIPRRSSTALFTVLLAALVITYNVLRSAPSNDTTAVAEGVVAQTQQGVATPQHRPQHKFLLLFSGHQGSSAIMDMLAQLPQVFVPGFEPLDSPGLSPAQKLAFLEALWTFPPTPQEFPQWRRELIPSPHIRVNRTLVRHFEQLSGKTVAGIKLRPYVPELGGVIHTAMTGLDRGLFTQLLHRYNVTLLVTLRRNPVKEALSWYKARELGLNQFAAAREQRGQQRRQQGQLGPGALEGGTGSLTEVGGVQAAGATPEQLELGLLEGAGSANALGNKTASGSSIVVRGSIRRGSGSGAAGSGTRALREALPAAAGAAAAAAAGSLGAAAAGGASMAAVAVNITQLLGWLNYTDHVNQQLRSAVRSFQRLTLEIYYEDFLSDPLGTVGAAARFIGADPTPLRPSAYFTKQAPDSLQDAVANFQELCQGLQGTPYFKFLDVESCPEANSSSSTQNSSSSSGGRSSLAGGAGQPGGAGGGAATAHSGHVPLEDISTPGGGRDQGPGQPLSAQAKKPAAAGLLANWCAPVDKRATGWEGLSDEECIRRARQHVAAAVQGVRQGRGTLLFKHVHKAGGTTMCRLGQRNMVAETAQLPNRADWDSNCVPYEAFLGPHPAVGLARSTAHKNSSSDGPSAPGALRQLQQQRRQQREWEQQQPAGVLPGTVPPPPIPLPLPLPLQQHAEASQQQGQQHRHSLEQLWPQPGSSFQGDSGATRQLQAAHWLGGACWFGFLTPAQLRVLPHHFRPLTFLASEGAMPDSVPLDLPFAMVTMLRRPLDRVLSSYRWWQLMVRRMPSTPAECRAYAAPPSASFEEWLDHYPDNWMTRELVGVTALHGPLHGAGAVGSALPPLDDTHLLLAKQRLHYFAAVLVVEQWEAAARVMRSLFGWEDVDFEGHRAGSNWNSSAEQELPAPLLRKLRQRNELDLQLYEYALALAAAAGAADAL